MANHGRLTADLIWSDSALEPYRTLIETAVDRALEDWSQVLSLASDVNMTMVLLGTDMSALASGRSLASAGTDLVAPDGSDVFQGSLRVLVLEGRDITPDGPDAEMTFGYDYLEFVDAAGDEVFEEFVDVAAHEIGHQLGFNSFAETDGVASVYDTFLETNAEGDLVFAGPYAVAANGGTPVALEGNGRFEITHVSEVLYPTEVMSPVSSPDEAIGPLTVAAIRDLGYSVLVDGVPPENFTLSDLVASPDLGGLDQIVSSEAAVRADPAVPDLTSLAPAGAATAGGDIAGFAPGASLSLGAGRDVLVLVGNRDDWLVEADPSGEVTLTPRDLDGTLSSVSAGRVSEVETLRFVGQDTANVLDDENIHLGRFAESEMARLYAAVFGREPDGPGLDYWITLRTDALTAQEVADRFMGSQEYIDRYGTDLSDQAFLNALYANVLGRDPDPDGNTYWRDQLSVGQRDRADVLVNFTNSAENVANTEHYIADLSAPWSNALVGTTSTSAVNALVAPDWDGMV